MADIKRQSLRERMSACKPDGFVEVTLAELAELRNAPIEFNPRSWLLYATHVEHLFEPSLTVTEPEKPHKTGLLDVNGNPLVRKMERVGFLK